jgi:predicted nucleic-acid-binding Zn-ribbon protein
MGLFERTPVTATVGDRTIACLVCGGGTFWDREIKLNTTGMEFFDLAWANASALGLVCVRCGYVHEFVGDSVQLWEADQPAE